MTFDEIKKDCVVGETVLINKDKIKRIYHGVTKGGLIIAEGIQGYVDTYSSSSYEHWTIKQPKGKLYVYIEDGSGEIRKFNCEKDYSHFTLLRIEEFLPFKNK